MSRPINRFEKWIIHRILRKAVVQSHEHEKNVKAFYGMIREACENEFTEDNAPTTDAFLRECFESTQYCPLPPIGTEMINKFIQVENMTNVVMDLHAALGVRWGDNPYAAIEKLKTQKMNR